MDREANLPLPSLRPPKNLVLPATNAADTTSSSSSSFSSSSSPPDFLRHVHAAFKRHRPLGIMQTNNSIKPRRTLIPQREASRSVASNVDPTTGTKKSQGVVPPSKDSIPQTKNPVTVIRETHADASPFPGTITKTFDESSNPFDTQIEQPESVIATKEDNQTPRTCVESQLVEGKRKVQFATVNKATSQGADDGMATGLGNLSSHMGSLALTEMEWDVSNQVEVSNVDNDEMKQQNFQNMESDATFRSDGAVTSLAKRAMVVQDQLHQLRNFLNQPATQSSAVGPSCATTTSVNSTSAPMLNSTTYCSRLRTESGSQSAVEPLRDSNANSHHLTPGNLEQLSHPLLKDTSAMLIDPRTTATQPSTSAIHSQFKELDLPKEHKGSVPEAHDIANDPSLVVDKPTKERGPADDGTDVQPQRPMSRNSSLNVKLEPSKPENKEKVASSSKGTSAPRKRSYDPDLFFKVNGKLYQRLGKIGSGGSSEVHKVISSDCTIYALKKIKLKGRDYGTAYGFCQEILYLNKLKGKNNIIQLIDYEVTDKALLHEVMNSSMSNKDGRVKDDGCIYMVLEYGEIDLAHMLAQKWKEMDSSNQTIDDNWLRFYWQQILQAVNTIHEERIVHSDLKPANFLLVKGSLKLIDFGIAKAIMSDTTNIQRDSQVGTLSYMSPEAFMCNESDANGNTIKCGRPSDIWSLGCILYQMVYGRTPFSEYKTFWAKFKVITDPNHGITYEPVSNPWLLDLMKKCLAWDRNERWRIPQLLQHPFLVPPIPAQPPVSQQQGCKLLQLVSETCGGDQEASMLCRELQQLLNPDTLTPESLISRDQQCKLLSQMSKLCFQLRECLAKLETGQE